MAALMIIEDEEVLAKNIARFFEAQGHTMEVYHDGAQGLDAALRLEPDLIIVDFQLPGLDGLEIIRALRAAGSASRIVMVTGHASVGLAVDAMKAGSLDLLTKPVTLASLKAVVERALADQQAQRRLGYYQQKDVLDRGLDALVGQSAAMLALKEQILSFAGAEPADRTPGPPILIMGATGTGKELVARACHRMGSRVDGPYVEVNCAALPAHLIEAELFGYEKGAFTDAKARKIGLFEAADGGVLFLDEIGELDLGLQAKLLRVLEDLKVRRLGALVDRQVNVRIVSATNRDLQRRVELGQFRADLLYRLKVFQIELPALCERTDDILPLANHFLVEIAKRYARSPVTLHPDAQAALCSYDWPGNVRELRNLLERAVLLVRGDVMRSEDLGLHLTPAPAVAAANAHDRTESSPASRSLETLEREHLLQALTETRWNVTQAARILQVSRDTLRYRMERHGLRR